MVMFELMFVISDFFFRNRMGNEVAREHFLYFKKCSSYVILLLFSF